MLGARLFVRLARPLLCVALTLPGVLVAAQQDGVRVDQVHAGSSLVALSDVPVRDRAPGGGALYVAGRQIGTLKPREIIAVNKEQTVRTVLGDQKWIYFSRYGSLSSGWVLVGRAGTTSDNFGVKH